MVKDVSEGSGRKGSSNGLDAALVESLAAIVTRHDLSEIEIEHGELRIRLARQLVAAVPMATAIPPSGPAPAGAVPTSWPRPLRSTIPAP